MTDANTSPEPELAQNPLAFPGPELNDDGTFFGNHPGMTLRDYYAGQALPAIIAKFDAETLKDVCEGIRGGRPIANGAYVLADAMLAARQ